MSRKFLLFGCGIGWNYGCDAIVFGTERILRKRFPDCQIWLPDSTWRKSRFGDVLGSGSGVLVKANDAISRSRHFMRRLCEKAGFVHHDILPFPYGLGKQSDCVLSIGGDLYTFAQKERDWPFPYPIMERGDRIMARGIPYVLWCASVGPLNKAGRRLPEMVRHLRSCRAILVREKRSFEYLQDILGLPDNLYLTADPAVVMEPLPFKAPFLESSGAEKLLAVNFSLGPLEHVHGPLPEQYVQRTLCSYLRSLIANLGIRILLVPHVHSDHGLLESLVDMLGSGYRERVAILPRGLGARRTKWAVSCANGLVTMRFHCALAGLSTATPTMILVSTAKGEKISEEFYGDVTHSLPIADVNERTLIAGVTRLLENEQSLRSQLTIVSEGMRQRAYGAGEVVANVLEGGTSQLSRCRNFAEACS